MVDDKKQKNYYYQLKKQKINKNFEMITIFLVY